MEANQIVVGMDNSRASAAALEWAMCQVRDGGTVVAVSVCGMRTPYGSADVFHSTRLRVMRDAIARISPREGVRVEQSVLDGEPGPALVKLAEQADSLVLGLHGYRRGGETVVGSVIVHCLKHASCPVVVVSSDGTPVT